jgi:hypothetical protein
MYEVRPKININGNEGEIDSLWVSDLNYLMARVFIPLKDTFINYNLGEYNPNKNMFTNIINVKINE